MRSKKLNGFKSSGLTAEDTELYYKNNLIRKPLSFLRRIAEGKVQRQEVFYLDENLVEFIQ